MPNQPPSAQQPPPTRYTQLDSLRGIAAVTVVLHHFALMWQPAAGYTGWPRLAERLLNPLATGREAVILFFLLSGFVLAIPYLNGKSQPYPTYLLRRILRIYGPYLIALALAVLGACVWHVPLGRSAWSDRTWSHPVQWKLVLQHIAFVGNYDNTQFNTAFWSLVAEMRVSIIYPALFLLVHALPVLSSILALIGLATTGGTTFQPVAIFAFGILLAMNITPAARWFSQLPRPWKLVFAATAFAMYTWGHHTERLFRGSSDATAIPITAAAAAFIVLAIGSVRVGAVLNKKLPRFLGRISYSLYLVHGTVLFALTNILQRRLPAIIQFPIYLVLSLALGTAFCLLVEEPFMRLSHKVGKRTAARSSSMPTPPSPR